MATQRVQIPISFSYPQNVFVSSSSSSFVSESATLLLPASGVTITVIDRNTGSPTTVFAASTGSGTLSPVVADSAGNVPGFVTEGSYTVQAAASGSFSGASVNWEAIRGDGVENIFPGAITTSALSSQVSQMLVPTGVILDFAGNSAPTGYALCDGTVYSQTNPTYAALYGVIGNTWNTGGEGTGNFRVPDFRGRVSIGAGAATSTTSARSLATPGGTETHSHSVPGLSVPGLSVPGLAIPSLGIPSLSVSVFGHVHSLGAGYSLLTIQPFGPNGFAIFQAPQGTGITFSGFRLVGGYSGDFGNAFTSSASTQIVTALGGTTDADGASGVTGASGTGGGTTGGGTTGGGTTGGGTSGTVNGMQPFNVTNKVIKL